MACRSALEKQKLLPIRSIHNHKIVSSTKNFQGQIWSEKRSRNQRIAIPQGRLLGFMLYLLYPADFPRLGYHNYNLCRRYRILAAHKNHIEASQDLQESLFYIQKWLKKWNVANTCHDPDKLIVVWKIIAAMFPR